MSLNTKNQLEFSTKAMDFSDDVFKDVFGGLYEPFAGLNEMDFELYGIYMDHEPQNEFLSPLNKCKDSFLNVLLSDDNLHNSSIADEVCMKNYEVTNGYGMYYEKCDNTRLVVRCGKRGQDKEKENQYPFRLYVGWMYNDKTVK
ncbi:unnamed protein product [Lactuca virosa]|uniref:Uncharacterized protein n=1 Tax=Lactuca virosa TaxID=75947 RepID=A0AAU9PVU0_9ASTR|nr:unnamed protein product [Lactuca virosa]